MSELSLNDVLPQTEGIALKEHFDEFSHEYDAIIKRAFPDYQEAFETLFHFTETSTNTPKILELGVGTGNLTLRALKNYPHAHYTLLDLSDEMLVQTASKLCQRDNENYTLIQKSFMDAEFEANSFDLVITSMALHHLENPDKKALYARIFQWLKPGGLFRCNDALLSLPAKSAHQKVWEARIAEIKPLGITDEEIAMWKVHEEQYDRYASMGEHFSWLKEAGFQDVDCYWKRHLLGVFGGTKP